MNAMDEALELSLMNCEPDDGFCKLRDELLPCEAAIKADLGESPVVVDDELAAKYKPIDLDALASIPHNKLVRGWPVPRFAGYDPFGSGECRLSTFSLPSRRVANIREFSNFYGFARKSWDARLTRHMLGFRRKFWFSICYAVACVAATIAISIPFGLIGLAPFGAAVAFVVRAFYFDMLVGWRDLDLTTNFSGVMPAAIRETIHELRNSHTFDSLLIVQEVKKWNVTVRAADPLLIGIKNGAAYLVDRFDTTTAEEYVAREFTS